jgi:arsenite methyltransferase
MSDQHRKETNQQKGNLNMTDNNTIHAAVRQHYGAIAAATSSQERSSCCGDTTSCDCGCSQGIYDMQLLEGLPVDVTNLSLGCGDPVTIASLQSGETVLDLGSGGGIDCFLAAKQVGDNGHVIGVDMTFEMLAKANANKQKMGAHNVEFRLGQIEALPVGDNTVDVIMSNCVINLSPDKARVFGEAYRVLKPGGRLAISDIVTEGEFSPELRAQTDKWAECVTGAIDVNAYTGIMREAGFTEVKVVDKADADDTILRQEGMPRIYSAQITGRKP